MVVVDVVDRADEARPAPPLGCSRPRWRQSAVCRFALDATSSERTRGDPEAKPRIDHRFGTIATTKAALILAN